MKPENKKMRMPTHSKIVLYASVLILALIPLFWLPPGYIDLGGDSSRLYFYDPINYLKSFPLYTIAPNGFNTENNASHLIPFTLFLVLLKKLFVSSYLIVTLFNSFTLVIAFLSVFGIVKILLKPYIHENKDNRDVYFAGISAGIFYTFSPSLTSLGWWTIPLYTHNQFFLNPLMFFLLLMYLVRKNFIYVLAFLLLSFVFSPNFFLSPYFFSFYPIAILFLLIYSTGLMRIRLNVKEIVIGICLFVFIHSFHLFLNIFDLFQKNSSLSQLVFSESSKTDRGLGYFLYIQNGTKIINNLLGLPQDVIGTLDIRMLWFIIPGLILIGLLLQHRLPQDRQIRRMQSLLVIFFLLTLYLATAKISFVGLELYKFLFTIPGFGMFRNYVGQFSHVYIFFYSLIFGVSMFYLFVYLRKFYKKITVLVTMGIIFAIPAFPFIRGDAINIALNPGSTEEIKMPIRMNPQYEKNVLLPIRENKFDSKYFLFPMDDSGAQVLRGEAGAYRGPPTIAYLTQKSVFSGLGGLDQFYKPFLSMIFNKDYLGINNVFSILNVKYLFFNSDEKIYGNTFSDYPYSQARKFMPLTQDLYKDFLELLAIENKTDLGKTYSLYELSKTYYMPHIYIAKNNYVYDNSTPFSFFLPLTFREGDNRIALFDRLSIKNNISRNIDGFYVEAKKNSELIDYHKDKQDAVTISDSVPIEIYTLLHPLLVLPEKTANDEENKSFRIYFDKGVYASSKIIKDLEVYTRKKPLEIAFVENKVNQYKQSMISLVDKIKKQNTVLWNPFMNIVRLSNILVSDQNKIYSFVKDSNGLSEREKKDLIGFIEKTFLDIKQYINIDTVVLKTNTYTVQVPEKGSYSLYMEKAVISNNGLKTTVTVGDKTFDYQTFKANDYWIDIGRYIIQDGQKLKLVSTMLDNIDPTKSLWGVPLIELQDTPYTIHLNAKGKLLGYLSNIIGDVADWSENTKYIVNFEYRMKNTDELWKKYKVIIETGDQAEEAHLFIFNNQNIASEKIDSFYQGSDIDIRNLAIISYAWPKIVLKKETDNGQKILPSITFTKINPIKYMIDVRNAKSPYTLVFLDAFDQNWKVFMSKDQKNNKEEKTASYYRGRVNEGKHKNEFLNSQTFETWGKKPLEEAKHFKVNGYANAWYIEPSDVFGKTDYALILEMTSQRKLYVLLPISFATASMCLVWIVGLLIRKKRISNKQL